MAASGRVRLLEIEPDIGGFLSEEERSQAVRLTVPVATVSKGTTDVGAKLASAGSFAALVLDGMLLHELTLAQRTAVRLLGPGDVVSAPGESGSELYGRPAVRAASQSRLALLGGEVLAAAGHWPRLVAGLHLRLAQQSERMDAQLAICQMPRVEDRLMAVLWLLAESWGRVTPHGTALPVSLTHGTLGAMIGARRPTVTLALGELTQRGALINLDSGWLLVESSPRGSSSGTEIRTPTLNLTNGSAWRAPPSATAAPEDDFEALASACAELRNTVAQLRSRHEQEIESVGRRLALMRRARERSRETLGRIRSDRLSRHWPTPSS